MQVEFWQTYSGNCPVLEDIQDQDPKLQKKILWIIGLLENAGLALSEPHLKKIGKGLYELRARFSNICYRILFVVRNNVAWFLHSFVKKDWKIPKRHIKTAYERAALVI